MQLKNQMLDEQSMDILPNILKPPILKLSFAAWMPVPGQPILGGYCAVLEISCKRSRSVTTFNPTLVSQYFV